MLQNNQSLLNNIFITVCEYKMQRHDATKRDEPI